MSMADNRRQAAGGGAERRLASVAFIALLLLSVFWPSPIVSINRLCCNAPLGVDELSFLGREAAAWDVAFWCIAGLFALALIDPSADYREPWRVLRAIRLRLRATDAAGVSRAPPPAAPRAPPPRA